MEKKTKYWLIPNNPNVYDAIGAFKELKEIDWGNKSNNKFKIGCKNRKHLNTVSRNT